MVLTFKNRNLGAGIFAVFAIVALLGVFVAGELFAFWQSDDCHDCCDDLCSSCVECISCLKCFDVIGVMEYTDIQALAKGISSAIPNPFYHQFEFAGGIDRPPRI